MAGRSRSGNGRRRGQRGIGYLLVLLWLALGSVVLTGEALLWSVQRQREREEQLLFVGDQIRRAIGSYHAAGPSEPRPYPPSLDVLLNDTRFLPARRHLRRLYRDPMTGTTDWGLVRGSDGGVIGVYSRSEHKPLRQTGFAATDLDFEGQAQYARWRFIHHNARTIYQPPVMLRPGVSGSSSQ